MNYFKCTNCQNEVNDHHRDTEERKVNISEKEQKTKKRKKDIEIYIVYKCVKCNHVYDQYHAQYLMQKRIEERAKELNCSVELIEYIENLEEKIQNLSTKIDELDKDKADKPGPSYY